MQVFTLPKVGEIAVPTEADLPNISTQFSDVLQLGGMIMRWSCDLIQATESSAVYWSTLPTVLDVPEPFGPQIYGALDGPLRSARALVCQAERLAKACLWFYDDAHRLPTRCQEIGLELGQLRNRIDEVVRRVELGGEDVEGLRGLWMTLGMDVDSYVRQLQGCLREWGEARDTFIRLVRNLEVIPSPVSGPQIATLAERMVTEDDGDLEDGNAPWHWYFLQLSDPHKLEEVEQRILTKLSKMTATEVANWTAQHPGVELAFRMNPPPVDGVARWWESLPELTQHMLRDNADILVGNLGGVPYHDRDIALRHYVNNDANWGPGAGNDTKRQRIREQLGRHHEPPLHLVSVDPSDPDQVDFSLGDLDSADHVMEVRGGMGTNISDSSEDNAAGLMNSAEGLMNSARKIQPGAQVAVIVSYYQAPEDWRTEPWSKQATMSGRTIASQAGALKALAARRGRSLSLTEIAHSYGTTVAAEAVAAAKPGTFDNVVMLAPVGTSAEAARALRKDKNLQLYYAEHPDDPWAPTGRVLTPEHGVNPEEIPGAKQIDPGTRNSHVEYHGFRSTLKRHVVTDNPHELNVSAGGPVEPGGFNSSGDGYLAPGSHATQDIARIGLGVDHG